MNLMSWSSLEYNEIRWVVIVRFVRIGGIVEPSFIEYIQVQMYQWIMCSYCTSNKGATVYEIYILV